MVLIEVKTSHNTKQRPKSTLNVCLEIEMSVLKRVQTKRSEERQGPTLGVHLSMVSIISELTLLP